MIPKYSINNVAYYIIYSNSSINSVYIKDIYFATVNFQQAVKYDVERADTGARIQNVTESELMSFSEAKFKLLAYLQARVTEVTNMTA